MVGGEGYKCKPLHIGISEIYFNKALKAPHVGILLQNSLSNVRCKAQILSCFIWYLTFPKEQKLIGGIWFLRNYLNRKHMPLWLKVNEASLERSIFTLYLKLLILLILCFWMTVYSVPWSSCFLSGVPLLKSVLSIAKGSIFSLLTFGGIYIYICSPFSLLLQS